jgi:hypothetical protein
MSLRRDFATNIRGWIRFVPTRSVLVAMSDGNSQIARGVVSNISESGARLVTNTVVDKGRAINLKLRFQKDELLETPARIVWCRESIEPATEIVGALQGVEFTELEPEKRQMMRKVLVGPDFRDVWVPKAFSFQDSKLNGALVDPDIERLFANLEMVDSEDEFAQIQKELLRDFDKLFAKLQEK